MALFSGNYNYVRDGANQALNRLVEYLLRQGVPVGVYSPTVEKPAFPATGDSSASRPSHPRTTGISWRTRCSRSEVRRDLEMFAPNIVHVSSPDIVGHRAVTYARRKRSPVVASVHTRFETYLAIIASAWSRSRANHARFYHRCEVIWRRVSPWPRSSARSA